MRVYTNKAFSRFSAKNGISDTDICEAVQRAAQGLIDADLGGGVIKQRIARRGEGRSGGFRVIILLRSEHRAVFVHGFAKKDVANIRPDELKALKKLAKIVLAYSDAQMATVTATGTFREVKCNGKTVS